MSLPPKAITIELMDVRNKRVLQKAKFVMPKGERMLQAGINKILETYTADLDARMPNHRYRVVPLAGFRFKMVWQKQTLAEMATEFKMAALDGIPYFAAGPGPGPMSAISRDTEVHA